MTASSRVAPKTTVFVSCRFLQLVLRASYGSAISDKYCLQFVDRLLKQKERLGLILEQTQLFYIFWNKKAVLNLILHHVSTIGVMESIELRVARISLPAFGVGNERLGGKINMNFLGYLLPCFFFLPIKYFR